VHVSSGVKREAIWFAGAALLGLVVLPLLVYWTGTETLGPYSQGGAGRFLSDFLRSLTRLEWQALTLALAPLVLIVASRVAWAIRGHIRREAVDASTEERDGYAPPASRREPTLSSTSPHQS
jgi:hypothetical protein